MKPQRKPHFKPLATALAATLQIAAIAAVPLAWDVRPGQPAPVTFDRYHGETIDFAATFRGFGELPFAGDADLRLWYQTNGMGTAWWSAPAAIQSNVITAVWSPEMDPGADRVSLFFGAPSNAYAAAVLRLRHSPGFAPGSLPDPETFQERDPVFEAWLAGWVPPVVDLTPATNYTDASISTNNAAFVSAVLAVPLTGADAADLAEIAEYGGYGTVGAAILALIAGLAAIKRRVAAAETSLDNKATKSTTLSGYGITDAKIQSGVITLGGQSITPLTSVPTATASQLGIAKPDGTTITIADGVLSAVGGGGGSAGYPVALLIHPTNWDNSQYVEADGVKYTKGLFDVSKDVWLYLFGVTTLRINFGDYGTYATNWMKMLVANGSNGTWETVAKAGGVATIQLTSGAYVEAAFDSCLAPDTEIMLADTSAKALEDICVGDMIMSPHGPDRVVRVSRGKGSATDEWEFEDGTVVRTIGRHRFWNCELGEPLYLEAWTIGEHARKPDGTTVALVSHRRIEGAASHSTLFTEKWNLYYAGGLLAGNRHSVKEVGL